MGFFSDVGRSTAFQTGQGVFKDVLASGAQEHQGLMDAVQLKNREDMVKMAQQEHDAKMAAVARDNEDLFVDETQKQGETAGMPTQTNWLMQRAKDMGIAKQVNMPDGTTKWKYRRGDLKDILSTGLHSKENEGVILNNKYTDLGLKLDGLQKSLGKAKDTTEQQTIQDNINTITGQRSGLRKSILLLAGHDPEIKEGTGTHQVVQGSIIQGDTGPIFQKGLGEGTKQYNTIADKHGDVVSILGEVTPKESQTPANEAFALWKKTHPNATPQESQKELERIMTLGPTIRAESMSSRQTNTPGVYFDSIKKKYFMNTDNGPMELTSGQAKQMNLSYQEDKPVTNIKAMQQNAPSVLFLSGEARKVVAAEIKSLGPMSSRWREFWAGKIGSPDPSFAKLKTNLNLLQTKLSQMHVGATGGIEMVKHFKETIESGKQSPENMMAALDAIDAYANEVKQKKFSGNDEESTTPPPPGGGSKFKIISVK